MSLQLLYLVGDGSVVFLVLDKFLNIYCLECMGIINRNLQIFTVGYDSNCLASSSYNKESFEEILSSLLKIQQV